MNMRTTASLVCPLLVIALAACEGTKSDKDIVGIDLARLQTLRSDAQSNPRSLLLVDPRAPEDFLAEHIPGSRNILLNRIPNQPDSTNPELFAYQNIVVYGENPASPTGKAMTKRLLYAGYDQTVFFTGGLSAWKAAKLETAGDAAGKEPAAE